MSYRLRWTPESKRTFNLNLDYLSRKWDKSVTNNFLDRVDEVLNLISENPLLYPVHRSDVNVHRCVINERIIVYYRIVDYENIDLITFWNTYRNPENLNL